MTAEVFSSLVTVKATLYKSDYFSFFVLFLDQLKEALAKF